MNLRVKEAWAGGPITTKKEQPVLTGILLVLGWKPQDWITKLEAYWKGFSPKVQKAQFLPVKAMRVIMSFVISKFEHLASGFPLEGPWLKKLQTTLNSVFCGVFGLSDRTAHLFLYLPPENGVGCPWLTIRADARYVTSVMKLEYGRSGLGKAVGE